MTDSEIIDALHHLSLKLVDGMRFAEADAVDQAIARIMLIPKAAQKIELGTWQKELDDVIGWIANEQP